jgi:uncharacterized membrane protein YphA (DoxX/SURF4 family)
MQTGDYNDAIALLLMRTVTGILFFYQGYDKLFNVKVENVVNTFSQPLSKLRLPPALLKPVISLSCWIELAGGLLLFLGLFRHLALYFLAIDMILVAFIFSSMKAMWDLQHYFPRLILIILLLFCLPGQDLFSLDTFLSLYK